MENKELADLKTIFGGAQTSKCAYPTSPAGGGSDTEYWVDGVHKATLFIGPLE